jgi:hypothetical protein
MKNLTTAAKAIASPFYAPITPPQKHGRGMLRVFTASPSRIARA